MNQSSTMDIHSNLTLVVVCMVAAHIVTGTRLDICDQERNCSRQTDGIVINCTVGGLLECRKAEQMLTQKQTANMNVYPFLTSLEVYDQQYSAWRTVKSLKFQYQLPLRGLLQEENIDGVLVKFYEHESSNNNPRYSPSRPNCQYYNISSHHGAVTENTNVDTQQVEFLSTCLGSNIGEGSFVLHLQAIPSPAALVYLISWTEDVDHLYDYGNPPIWSEQVIAVAVVPEITDVHRNSSLLRRSTHRVPSSLSHESRQLSSSIHVIFQPADPDNHVTFYDVDLIDSVSKRRLATEFIQGGSHHKAYVFFHGVAPGSYQARVTAQAYNCDVGINSCPSLLSLVLIVDDQPSAPETRDQTLARINAPNRTANSAADVSDIEPPREGAKDTAQNHTILVVGVILSIVAVLAVSAACAYLVYRARKETTKQDAKIDANRISSASRDNVHLHIAVTSLAERSLEKLASEYFCQFLTDSVGAVTMLSYPFMPLNARCDSHSSSHDSEEPLLQSPTSSDEGNCEKLWPPRHLSLILRFDYIIEKGYEYDDFPPSNRSVVEGQNGISVRSNTKLQSIIRRSFSDDESQNVWCVSFVQSQCAPTFAPSTKTSQYDAIRDVDMQSEWTDASIWQMQTISSSPDDSDSVHNKFNPDPDVIHGLPHFKLPRDMHKLYNKLTSFARKSNKCNDSVEVDTENAYIKYLNAEHSKSISNALDVFRKAAEQPLHIPEVEERYERSTSCSLVTLNNMGVSPGT